MVHRETFLTVHLHQSIRHRHLVKECFTLGIKNATGGNPVRDSTGRLVARCEERNRDTVPTPRFARKPSTLNSFFPAEGSYPQNYVAEQARLQISEVQFDKFPTPPTFSCWKIKIRNPGEFLFRFRSEAMLSTKEVRMVDSMDDFKSSHSIQCFF